MTDKAVRTDPARKMTFRLCKMEHTDFVVAECWYHFHSKDFSIEPLDSHNGMFEFKFKRFEGGRITCLRGTYFNQPDRIRFGSITLSADDLDDVHKMPVDCVVCDEYRCIDSDCSVLFRVAEDKGNHSLEFDVRLFALLRVAMPEVWENIRAEVETRAA